MIRVRVTARSTIAMLASAGGLLAGCGGTSGHSGEQVATNGGRLPVVAAENFYGDLMAQVGGERVAATSILSNPDADPHLFEPGTQNALAVANARAVVRNGDGYDDWMTKLLDAAPSPRRRLVTVADVVPQPGPDPNPQLWYDTPALPQIVTTIGDTLAAAGRRPAAAGGPLRRRRRLHRTRARSAAGRRRAPGTDSAGVRPGGGERHRPDTG